MRSSPRRFATTIIVGTLIAACSANPSLSPATSLGRDSSENPAPAPPGTNAPTSSTAPIAPRIVAISAGYGHTCALTAGGGVQCWGSNGGGQLGDGTTTDRTTPVDVVGLGSGIIAISAGGAHTCAITTGGGVKCWGGNDRGGLGNGTTEPSVTPVDVSGLASGVSAISAGLIHTCALTIGGGVKCWGYNGFGGLGIDPMVESLVPADVSGLASGVTAVAAGYEHTCALTIGGGVKCWGSRTGAELGNGSTSYSAVPVDVQGLRTEATAIAAGPESVCAVKSGSAIFCWGSGYDNTPVGIRGVRGEMTALSGGSSHRCALTSLGGVTCWGANHYGQLGNRATQESELPVDVSGLASGVIAIDAGYDHTCVLTSRGEVKCWGDNWTGQLGNGRPCDTRSSATAAVDVAFTELPGSEPSPLPSGPIQHAMGPKDVVLRFDVRPDLSVGELEGELFQPGPEFTLYGDGTAIFRDNLADLPPAEGPIVRARPFTTAHLTEDLVQELLRFALGEGGLTTACDRYETRAVDGGGSWVFMVRAGLVSRRIESFGDDPFGPLVERLRNLGRGGDIPTGFWSPDRFRGSLFDVDPENYSGVLPDPDDVGSFAWPWPGLTPDDFVRPPAPDFGTPRRVMSAAEAAVHGFSNNGGLVKRAYLYGPDRKTLYYFSMWPVFPDETS